MGVASYRSSSSPCQSTRSTVVSGQTRRRDAVDAAPRSALRAAVDCVQWTGSRAHSRTSLSTSKPSPPCNRRISANSRRPAACETFRFLKRLNYKTAKCFHRAAAKQPRSCYEQSVYLSVYSSVRLSNAWIVRKRKDGSAKIRIAYASSFPIRRMVGGRRIPSYLKFWTKVTPFENGYFHSLVTSSKKNQLSRIGSVLRVFQWTQDEQGTLPLSPYPQKELKKRSVADYFFL